MSALADPVFAAFVRGYLSTMADDWRLTGSDFRPSGEPFAYLARRGLAEARRDRPRPASPLRWYVRRTAAGRALVERSAG